MRSANEAPPETDEMYESWWRHRMMWLRLGKGTARQFLLLAAQGWHLIPKDRSQPEPKMSIERSVAEILSEHGGRRFLLKRALAMPIEDF